MHVPVLLYESIEALNIQPGGIYVDATFGGGGHSQAILNHLDSTGRLIAFDQDQDAKQRVIDDSRFLLIPENFRHLRRFLRLNQVTEVNGILADLGMSSFQLDSEDRGFSTRFDAPLDMRMNTSKTKTAAQVMNTYSTEELQLIFQDYGELRNAKSLAHFIVESRSVPFKTTQDFIGRIQHLIKGNPNRYLAQVFQALRIEVNDELAALKDFLKDSVEVLIEQGNLAVITFHSLEDRLVKRFFKTGTFGTEPEKDEFGRFEKPIKEVNKKPIVPTEKEMKENPRSRSAKLRIAKKQKS